MDEATIKDGVPTTAGWFVINAGEARWMHNDMRAVCKFGGEGPAHFDDLGIGLYWIEPGKPMTLYHHEAGQEDFLVLRGRCVLVIEGEERTLGAWDFVHCPPGTAHTIVAAGPEPALVLAVGARQERGSARYPFAPAAVRHGAGVPDEETSARDHYATFGAPRPGAPPAFFAQRSSRCVVVDEGASPTDMADRAVAGEAAVEHRPGHSDTAQRSAVGARVAGEAAADHVHGPAVVLGECPHRGAAQVGPGRVTAVAREGRVDDVQLPAAVEDRPAPAPLVVLSGRVAGRERDVLDHQLGRRLVLAVRGGPHLRRIARVHVEDPSPAAAAQGHQADDVLGM